MRRIVPIAILLLEMACAPAASPSVDVDASAPTVAPPAQPLVPDADEPEIDRCRRADVVWLGDRRVAVELPCKPFNPLHDLGYPLP